MRRVQEWSIRCVFYLHLGDILTQLQTLVSSILLRPHATDTDATMLPSTSHIRVQVEDTRMDLLKWLKKKWVGVQQEGGFNDLEGWAVKEISGGQL